MSMLNQLLIKLTCSFKNFDHFGNRYYESNKLSLGGRKKRYVIYNGRTEPSKVPPLWHAWLHYIIDDIPKNENLLWQQDHLPNLTGTKSAYNPSSFNKKAVSTYYLKWQPK